MRLKKPKQEKMYIGMEINGRWQRISPHFSHVIIDNRGLTFCNSTEEQVGLVSATLRGPGWKATGKLLCIKEPSVVHWIGMESTAVATRISNKNRDELDGRTLQSRRISSPFLTVPLLILDTRTSELLSEVAIINVSNS